MRNMATWDKQRPWHHRRWIVLMFTLVVTAGLCKLSLWQWQRGMEKEAWLGADGSGAAGGATDACPDRLAQP